MLSSQTPSLTSQISLCRCVPSGFVDSADLLGGFVDFNLDVAGLQHAVGEGLRDAVGAGVLGRPRFVDSRGEKRLRNFGLRGVGLLWRRPGSRAVAAKRAGRRLENSRRSIVGLILRCYDTSLLLMCCGGGPQAVSQKTVQWEILPETISASHAAETSPALGEDYVVDLASRLRRGR